MSECPTPDTPARPRPRRRARGLGAWGCIVVAFVAATYASSRPADAASTSVVVTMNVASQVSLSNACSAPAATSLGIVQPGTSALTATGAGVCSLGWSSSNDTSKLRISMRDATAPAMAQENAAWNNGRSSGMSRIMGMVAYSSSVVFAVGDNGDVYRTVDAGATWRSDYVTSGHWFFDIEPVPGDNNRWVAVAGDGEVYSTTNGVSSLPGAATWTLHKAALLAAGWDPGADVQGVAVIDASTWMVGGDQGWIARTTNAGASWTAYQVAGVGGVTDIDAISATEYVAGTGWGRMLRTTTSGINAGSWTTYNSGNPRYVSDIAVGDATHVYFASRAGVIYRWNGVAFQETATAPSGYATRLLAVTTAPGTPTTLWVSGDFGITWKSTDSGATWTRQQSRSVATVDALSAATASTVYTGGGNNDVTRSTDGGSTWSYVRNDPTKPPMLGIDADPVDGRRAVAVGGDGAIFRTLDKGGTWSAVASGTSAHLFDVHMATSSVGWAVGSSGTIISTNDGGATWSPQTSGVPTISLRAVTSFSENVAWAVGDAGTVIATTNGGTTWVAQNATTTQDLIDVAASSATNAVLVGAAGRVRYTNDGGTTWQTPASGPTQSLREGVVSLGPSTYVIMGFFGDTHRSIDGGVTWSLVSWGWGEIVSLDAAGNVVKSVTAEGDVGWSSDGGLTWDTESSYAGRGIMALAAVDINSDYFAKTSSSIWDTDETANAALRISDYGAGANFGSGAATNMFGVCLQAVGATTSPSAGWSVDPGGACTTSDADPWRAVPVTSTDIATTTLGSTGRVDLVWGVRLRSDQAPGAYSAGVAFEAIAPG